MPKSGGQGPQLYSEVQVPGLFLEKEGGSGGGRKEEGPLRCWHQGRHKEVTQEETPLWPLAPSTASLLPLPWTLGPSARSPSPLHAATALCLDHPAWVSLESAVFWSTHEMLSPRGTFSRPKAEAGTPKYSSSVCPQAAPQCPGHTSAFPRGLKILGRSPALLITKPPRDKAPHTWKSLQEYS